MIEIAQSINTLPYPSTDSAFLASPLENTVTNQLLAELQALRKKIQGLRDHIACQDERIASLESSQNRSHEALALDIAHDRQRLTRLEQSEQPQPTGQGKKTKVRAEKLKVILKRCGGSRAFTQLQKDLDLSPTELTRLVATLDKRSYEVRRKPGGRRGEKVLSLRVKL
jgi:hypothetical protein